MRVYWEQSSRTRQETQCRPLQRSARPETSAGKKPDAAATAARWRNAAGTRSVRRCPVCSGIPNKPPGRAPRAGSPVQAGTATSNSRTRARRQAGYAAARKSKTSVYCTIDGHQSAKVPTGGRSPECRRVSTTVTPCRSGKSVSGGAGLASEYAAMYVFQPCAGTPVTANRSSKVRWRWSVRPFRSGQWVIAVMTEATGVPFISVTRMGGKGVPFSHDMSA